jgi:hypothetical protein
MAVWMLHPIELNKLSGIADFPNTWTDGKRALDNFRLGFIFQPCQPTEFPLAVQASAVDTRVVVQRSCFTIHGTDKRDFETMLGNTNLVLNGYFRKFTIPRSDAATVLDELIDIGISFTTVFPDFVGLAKELKLRFGPKPTRQRCLPDTIGPREPKVVPR